MTSVRVNAVSGGVGQGVDTPSELAEEYDGEVAIVAFENGSAKLPAMPNGGKNAQIAQIVTIIAALINGRVSMADSVMARPSYLCVILLPSVRHPKPTHDKSESEINRLPAL
jgi:hypothetical protein